MFSPPSYVTKWDLVICLVFYTARLGSGYPRILLCRKKNLYLCYVNSFDFAREKLHERFSTSAVFSSTKSNQLTDQQDMFSLNHAYAFYTINSIMKNVDE